MLVDQISSSASWLTGTSIYHVYIIIIDIYFFLNKFYIELYYYKNINLNFIFNIIKNIYIYIQNNYIIKLYNKKNILSNISKI